MDEKKKKLLMIVLTAILSVAVSAAAVWLDVDAEQLLPELNVSEGEGIGAEISLIGRADAAAATDGYETVRAVSIGVR